VKLKDKIAVVTGGGNGIGEALAQRFAREGATGVVVSDLDLASAERVAAAIRKAGGKAIGLRADVSVESDIVNLVKRAEAEFGPVDLICSNAGLIDEGGADAPDQKWNRSWAVNVMAHVYAARAVLPSMTARKQGYILSTCSAAGLLTSPGAAPYAVTKHAAIAFAEWLSIMHGNDGIKVSVICPQAVRTKLLRDSIESGNAASKAFSEVGTLLEPDAVADVTIKAIEAEEFLILPHPEVKDFVQRKVANVDRWLAGMRRFVAQALVAQKS
jgi:NAD(P)-dependent dehydrogenase (short-subunit alcohol dehydrogenase family)